MPPPPSRPKRILFALTPAFLLLVVLEVASYFYYRHRLLDDFMAVDVSDSFHNIPDLFEVRQTDAGEVLFSRHFPTRYYMSDRNYRGKTMSVVKTPKTFRIFSFGGSSTAGSPWGHEASFSRFLEDELISVKRDGTRVEVVNFGGSGYASTRALGLVKASIRYQPDLLVIYVGHNEIWDNYLYVDLAKSQMTGVMRRWGDHLYTVRVGRTLLQKEMAKPRERVDLLTENSMFIPPLIKENKGFKAAERRYLAAQYKQNLMGIIATAKEHQVAVLLVSQPAHFYYRPEWYPTEADAREKQLVEEMEAAHRAGDRDLAKARAIEILELNRENPLPHFYLGLIAQVAGNSASAREHFLSAIDLDERPLRYNRRFRAIEQGLADDRAGVYFVDMWKEAAEFLGDGLIDGRLIVDRMHPVVECNKLIARTIERDFFVRHQIRTDLFDYARVDLERVWKNNIDPSYYLMICARYFEVGDPAQCVPAMYEKYLGMRDGTSEKGIFRNSWEYLFYYGRLTGDAAWFDKSAGIYAGPSLKAYRATRTP